MAKNQSTSNEAPEAAGGLVRRLGTADAVIIGMGSMIGAGVFVAFGPAAKAAGSGLLIGLAIAAVVAYCNAIASAQLAAVYPTSGGTYIYGRERLGHGWGFVAGWGFVIGKTASCAAIALTVGSYMVPDSAAWWVRRLIAVAAVIALAALNYRGITKTAALTRVFVSIAVACLVAFVIAVLAFGHPQIDNLDGWTRVGTGGGYGILQAAGLLFFAFAGYARIATMGEEVRNPSVVIPRAIQIALFLTVVIYLVVGFSALVAAGPAELAQATAPLSTAATSAGVAGVNSAVRLGAIVASLGSLLALIAGVGRTSLAMGRDRELPHWLAAVHPRYRVPHHAEITIAVIVSALVMTTDLRGVIGFSSFGVLIYYAIANASAFTQPVQQRRWPRAWNIFGIISCLVLVATLPVQAVVAGVVMFAVGLFIRAFRHLATR